MLNDAKKLYEVVTMPQDPPSGDANQEKVFKILEFLMTSETYQSEVKDMIPDFYKSIF